VPPDTDTTISIDFEMMAHVRGIATPEYCHEGAISLEEDLPPAWNIREASCLARDRPHAVDLRGRSVVVVRASPSERTLIFAKPYTMQMMPASQRAGAGDVPPDLEASSSGWVTAAE
jgi:hypothetical protein